MKPGSSCEVPQTSLMRFRGCRRDPHGTCIYCGRIFCREHGEVGKDGQGVCSRRNCVAKRDDLAVHLVYKERVLQRNAEGSCGVAQCDARMEGQCTRCRALFCRNHLGSRPDTARDGTRIINAMATLCDNCWHRRPIWTRK